MVIYVASQTFNKNSSLVPQGLVLRYIHQNPVKADIYSKADDYDWSSWPYFMYPI